MKEKLLVILGPTATGKTDLSLEMAKRFNGELVAADSRQVYLGLDIGTGKYPGQTATFDKHQNYWEINKVKVWMYDVVDPKVQYSVAAYVKDAKKIIKNILNKNKLPIIVGGSGLYLKAILEGLPNLRVPVDKNLRKELEKLSLKKLQKKLQELSSKKWEAMNNSDRQNKRRLVRQIEVVLGGGVFSKQELVNNKLDVLKIGLTAPREVLYRKVDERIDDWIEGGIVQEVETLNKQGINLNRFRNLGLEYRAIADYLDDKLSLDEMKIVMQGELHGYLRRQQTWFKKDQDIVWFDVADQNFMDQVENKIRTWYYSS